MKKYISYALLIIFGVLSVSAQKKIGTFHQEVNWSPDGKYISFSQFDLFMEGNKRKMKADVYVVRSDGKGLRKITGDEKNEYFSTWSKNGKKIAFSGTVQGSKTADIFVVGKNGKGLKQLTKDSGRNSGPAFSPDGKKIAFMSKRDGKYQIYVMDADGKNRKRLTTDPKIAYYNPQWSPDGKKLVYYSEKGDNKDQIWIMNSDGSNPKLLTDNIGHNIYPTFSPDGKKVVFISARDGKRSLVCKVNPDGSGFEVVKGISAAYIRYSPDGKKVAYVSGKFPKTDIYIANADGSEAVKLIKE